MAKRIVRWTRTADIQFVGVLKYWVERNQSATYSKKLIKEVNQKTSEIVERPNSFKETEKKRY